MAKDSLALGVKLTFQQLERYFNNGATRAMELVVINFEKGIKASNMIPVDTGATKNSTRVYMAGKGGFAITRSGIVKGFQATWTTPYAGYIYPWGGPYLPYGNPDAGPPGVHATGIPYWGIRYLENHKTQISNILKSQMSDRVKSKINGLVRTSKKTIYIKL